MSDLMNQTELCKKCNSKMYSAYDSFGDPFSVCEDCRWSPTESCDTCESYSAHHSQNGEDGDYICDECGGLFYDEEEI